MSRLLLASNRLPVTVSVDKQGMRVVPSMGGLATGLRAPHTRSGGLWIGWPGDVHRLRPEQRAAVDAQLQAMGLVPIDLSAAEVQHYYHGFANGVLWPLFHYLIDRVPAASHDWEAYRQVNERFAGALADRYRAGDTVWVHDYQLALVPALLRRRIPDARIGFFLHIPFPSSEVFRILSWRAEILEGMLGADLVGFHTYAYARYFATSLVRVLGLDVDLDRVWYRGREVRLGAYPMGIDAAFFESAAQEPEVVAEAAAIRGHGGGARIVLGVDRLDYTKGIPRRLLAFERLLEHEPSWRGRARFVQVAVPSRGEVPAYEQFKHQVDELVGRINGRYGTTQYVPIHYLHRGFSQKKLVALYCAADVMAVTPLRDGLNLVAKEFVACRTDLGAVLVLSEFAGAASELAEAVLVNPYDIDAVARALAQALHMSPEERAARLRAMRERVRENDVHRWVAAFLDDLGLAPVPVAPNAVEPGGGAGVELVARLRGAGELVLLLDYDGTLVPLRPRPDQAAPDGELLGLLERLSRRPGTAVHVVSGRDRATLERWLGALPIGLHAEHGLWSRPKGSLTWAAAVELRDEWKAYVRPVLQQISHSTPGSFVEEKSGSMAWHFRQADPGYGPYQAKELRLHLLDLLSNTPVAVVAGDKVVEIRLQGADKGAVVRRLLADAPGAPLLAALGDDRTDEDMFASLPPGGLAIHVGPGPSRAPHRLADPAAARALLAELLSPG
ncbi:MAG: bifunctional alpha,alpha-trehalose-phosphate synthase (UDP-forming)/trehalose-phosphatase [Deltaproteobacteria bacterium]|nr:bifunctional alpha,alpha-trehalose-phosphate synthase (UDP-forming)/trehalose-phosphatase [Deltaproteobacteria bacterium]